LELLKRLFRSPARQAPRPGPATGDQLRRNVRELGTDGLARKQQLLLDGLHAQPVEHPGDLFYRYQTLAQDALQLAMLDWRQGADPRPHLAVMRDSLATARTIRPDIAPTYKNAGFMAMVFDLRGWNWPFSSDPPGEEDLVTSIVWLERWIIAGLANPAGWPLKDAAPKVKNQFVQKTLDDYWALLTGQVDPAEGMQRCIRNYDRRATHPTFKAVSGYLGGGAYNELFVDYTLAAIMRKRGLASGTVHDWIWD
jgi:hypothetical protein